MPKAPGKPETPKKDFFISYKSEDEAWAGWIAETLETAGYSTYIAKWDFEPGRSVIDQMDKGLTECERTVLVLSPRYRGSAFTAREWQPSLHQAITGNPGKILPVMVEKCDPTELGILCDLQYIDLVGTDAAAGVKTLLEGVKVGRRKPAGKTTFPVAAKGLRFPGALPPVWHVPYVRNRYFTGRGAIIDSVRTGLASAQTVALVALEGMGGVGKTQVAIEYAYRFMPHYETVFWIEAENSGTLDASFLRLARSLEIDLPDERQDTVREGVKAHIGRSKDWLLVFDNADEPGDIKPYLPQGGSGHVIITSRNRAFDTTAQPINVTLMAPDEAVEFTLRRSGSTERDAAAELAHALGRLPLALEHAGAYIRETGKTVAAYLALFHGKSVSVLGVLGSPADYRHTVLTTWLVSIEEAGKVSKFAGGLLNLLSFFAPDDIPVELLRKHPNHLPEALAALGTDEVELDRAVGALSRYSLVTATGQLVSVHRILQEVVREGLTPDERVELSTSAVRIVNAALPDDPNDHRNWPIVSPLLAHGIAAAGHAEATHRPPKELGRLLNQLGMYQHARAAYKDAKVLFERALEIDETAYGPNHPKVAIIVNNLGGVLRALGDLRGAKAHYERALNIVEQAFGEKHRYVATGLNNLGGVLESLGDLAAAKAHFERALSILEKFLGPDHPTTTIVRNNLAAVQRQINGG